MTDSVNIIIDGKSISIPAGTTILDAAREAGIEIPTICYHEATTSYALCRICVVEVEGSRVLVPSCVANVSEGMNVQTKSERVIRSRRTILELMESTTDLSDSPEILQMMEEYQTVPDRYPQAVERAPAVIDDNPMFLRDYAKCILCWRCVQVCADDAQYAFAINFSGRGYDTQINTFYETTLPESTCVFCGQCVGVCPTGALKPKRQWLLEQGRTPDEIMDLTRSERRARRRRIESDSFEQA